MSNSGGESPDWLRSFQAPDKSFLALSSDSDPDPSTNDNSEREDDNHIEEPVVYSPSKLPKEEQNKDAVLIDSGDDSPVRKPPKSKSPKKRVKVESKRLKEDKEDDVEAVKQEISEKSTELNVSSRMPLLMPEKVHRSKALVECEGDIDMSGDVGAVGRFVVSDTASGNHEVLLDLKGTIYKTTIVPSRTFCIVNFGPTEAKIEAVMNDFIQLKPHSNVYESETMVEGTLEGFSFDSDEEADKNPKANGQGNDAEDGNETGEQTNKKKTKGKADKSLGVSQKKGKIAGKAPPKKARMKAQVPKKSKGAKK